MVRKKITKRLRGKFRDYEDCVGHYPTKWSLRPSELKQLISEDPIEFLKKEKTFYFDNVKLELDTKAPRMVKKKIDIEYELWVFFARMAASSVAGVVVYFLLKILG